MKQSLKVLVAASFVLCVSNALAANEFVKKTFVASNKLQLPYRAAEKADPNGGRSRSSSFFTDTVSAASTIRSRSTR